MTAQLAHLSNRAYVFEDYVWSKKPFPYTLYDFTLRPTRIPINAFVSGFIGGAQVNISNPAEQRSVGPFSSTLLISHVALTYFLNERRYTYLSLPNTTTTYARPIFLLSIE